MKLIKVHPFIYTRGHTRKLSTPDVLATLEAYGIQNVLNVSPSIDPYLEHACVDAQICYKHIPLVDGPRVQEAEVARATDFLVDQVCCGIATVVHCNAGRNRTGLVVGLALLRLDFGSPTEVLAHLHAVRPGVLANVVFERYLLNGGKQ